MKMEIKTHYFSRLQRWEKEEERYNKYIDEKYQI